MAKVDFKINDKLLNLVKSIATKKGQEPHDIVQEAILKQFCSLTEEQQYLESISNKGAALARDFDISLNSLRIKQFRCIFCKSDDEFEAPLLKTGSQVMDVNPFEVLIYKEASASKFDFCDFSLIEAYACPGCGFTSKFESHFESKNFKGEWECKLDPSVNVRKSVEASKDDRLEKLAEVSDNFNSERRPIEDAIIAGEVAIMSATTIMEASIDTKKPGWHYIIGNWHLQLYEFHRHTHNKEEQKKHLLEAAKHFNTAHKAGLNGDPMYRTAYILTVFAIKRKDVQTARSMWGFLNKALQGAAGQEKATINKYLPRVKDMYQDFALALRSKNKKEDA